MFIEIDLDLGNLGNDFTPLQIDALSNLARSGREGRHIIVALREDCLFLSKLDSLSQRDRSYYRTIASRLSTIYPIKNRLTTQIYVKRNIAASKSTNGANNILSLPLEHFSDSRTTESTRLVCENLDDCYVYTELYGVWGNLNRLNIRCSFEPEHGGGNTISRLAERHINEGYRLALILTDSDRDFKEDKLGATANDVENKIRKNAPILVSHTHLNVRELENLLPDEVYTEHIHQNYKDHRDAMEAIGELSIRSFKEARLYIDLKNGLKLHKLLRLADSEKPCCQATWEPILREARGTSIYNKNVSQTCIKDSTCKMGNHADCTCYVVGRGRDDTLEISRTILPRLGRQWCKNLCPELSIEFDRIMEELLNWGCSLSRMSA